MVDSEIKYELTTANVWYLEMNDRPEFENTLSDEWQVHQLEKPVSVKDYRYLYFGVGEKWNWLDRMVMHDEILSEKINNDNTEIFVLLNKEQPAGYIELVTENDRTEIQYFGLMPEFIGKGIGKRFLQWSIMKAWSFDQTKLVTLNTCSLDHESALSIYQSCGFKIIREQTEERKKRIQ
jgi:ribosomal protein S18 acetylase RimI-like enzyme